MARRRGMSASVPGAVDVETDDGQVIPLTPELADLFAPAQQLGGPGASAPIAYFPQEAPGIATDAGGPAIVQPGTRPAPTPMIKAFPEAGTQTGTQGTTPIPIQAPPTQPGAQQPPVQGVFASGGQPQGPGPNDRLAMLDQLTGGLISGQGGGGGASGPRVTTTMTGTQESLVGTPEQQAALAGIGQERGALEQQEIDAARGTGERQARAVEAQAEQQAQANEQVAALEAQRIAQRRPFEEARAQYVQRADQLAREVAAGRIDRGRIWANQDEGTRLGAAISIAVGAFAQGLTGAPNIALETINEAIDRDINEQMANMDAQRSALADARGAAQMGRELLGDFDEETAMLREAKLADVQRRIQESDLLNQPAEIRAGAEEIVRGLEAQRLAARQAGIEAGMQRVVREQQTVQRRGGGGGRRGLSVGDAIRVAEFAGAGPQEIDREGVRNVSQREQTLVRADEALGRLESMIQGDNLPGVGLVGGRVPDTSLRIASALTGGSVGAPALEARRAVRDARGAFTRIRTGAGMPIEEADREADILGLREDATAEEVIAGIRDARRLVERERAVIRSGVDDVSRAEFQRRVESQGGASRSGLDLRRPGE